MESPNQSLSIHRSLGVSLLLEEIYRDVRDNERAVKLSLINGSGHRISVLKLRHLMSNGVSIKQLSDGSLFHFDDDYKEICKDLRRQINDEFFFGAKGLIQARKAMMSEIINDTIGGNQNSVAGILRVLIGLTFRLPIRLLLDGSFRERYEALQIPVNDLNSARSAVALIKEYQVAQNGFTAEGVIRDKLALLEGLEVKRSASMRSGGRLSIEAGETYIESYVLSFPRHLLSSRIHSVQVELEYGIADHNQGDDTAAVKRAGLTVDITPSGIVLSLVACASALIGGFSKSAAELPTLSATNMLTILKTPTLWTGIAVGFVMFNLYDRLDVKWAKALRVSWPTAVLVGFVAGFYGDRFLKAIQVFFGIG